MACHVHWIPFLGVEQLLGSPGARPPLPQCHAEFLRKGLAVAAGPANVAGVSLSQAPMRHRWQKCFPGKLRENRREAVVFWCFLPCAKKKCAPGLQQMCTATVRSSVHAKRGHNGTLGGTMYHFSCASNLVQEAWIVSRSGKLVSQTRERWEHTSPIHGVHVVRPNHKIS